MAPFVFSAVMETVAKLCYGIVFNLCYIEVSLTIAIMIIFAKRSKS